MPYKDPEKAKQYNREYAKKWRDNNKERYDKRMKEWREKNKDKVHNYQQKYYWANREKEIIRVMEGNKKRYRKWRLQVIEHYGGKCECCGESRIQFLAIDHINGNGNKHRKEIKESTRYTTIQEYLVKNNYPNGYRILCHNCNMSIGFYGYCPHQLERGEITEDDIKI